MCIIYIHILEKKSQHAKFLSCLFSPLSILMIQLSELHSCGSSTENPMKQSISQLKKRSTFHFHYISFFFFQSELSRSIYGCTISNNGKSFVHIPSSSFQAFNDYYLLEEKCKKKVTSSLFPSLSSLLHVRYSVVSIHFFCLSDYFSNHRERLIFRISEMHNLFIQFLLIFVSNGFLRVDEISLSAFLCFLFPESFSCSGIGGGREGWDVT